MLDLSTFYTELRPSLLPNAGVGVFAIRHIPQNTPLFMECPIDTDFIPASVLSKYDPAISKTLKRLCLEEAGGIYLSIHPNLINMSYYVNHAETPNLTFSEKTQIYLTLRDIKPNEELTVTYTPEERNGLPES